MKPTLMTVRIRRLLLCVALVALALKAYEVLFVWPEVTYRSPPHRSLVADPTSAAEWETQATQEEWRASLLEIEALRTPGGISRAFGPPIDLAAAAKSHRRIAEDYRLRALRSRIREAGRK